MILTDLVELKEYLEIDPRNTKYDRQLLLFAESASAMIEEFLDRSLEKKSRTEFYDGSGTRELILRARPVFTSPTPRAFWDNGGFFGEGTDGFDSTTELDYGDDFVVRIDDSDSLGVGQSGILLRQRTVWERPQIRSVGLVSPYKGKGWGNIKVIYTAGYEVDTLPSQIRLACNMLVARLRYVAPTGMEIGYDSYEELSRAWITPAKGYMMSLVKPLIWNFRNHPF